jgi:CubicO group peptidase (beta-lactamase class C family)
VRSAATETRPDRSSATDQFGRVRESTLHTGTIGDAVTARALLDDRLARLDHVMTDYARRGDVHGLVWAVARRGQTHVGTAGIRDASDALVERDSIFRISSMTKPVTAVAAMILLEECRLRLDDPVDALLPELADARVLASPTGPLENTVPAARPITTRDLLTFRMGSGMDFTAPFEDQPLLAAFGQLGLGVGPPSPQGPPAPDEWIRRFATLPLAYQPGDRWLYHTSAEVLGVLVERAACQPFESFLRERIFDRLGMTDTGFAVPTDAQGRFGSAFWTNPETSTTELYDAADGQWSTAPAFGSGGAGLVSTVDDFLAFAEMLRAGGTSRGVRVLSRPSVDAMVTNQLTPHQLAASAPDPSGALGWGFGLGVTIARTGPTRLPGSYGWDGGLGSSWANDPAEDLIGILLTNEAFTSPTVPPVVQDFWTCAYAAVAD